MKLRRLYNNMPGCWQTADGRFMLYRPFPLGSPDDRQIGHYWHIKPVRGSLRFGEDQQLLFQAGIARSQETRFPTRREALAVLETAIYAQEHVHASAETAG